MNHGHRSTPRVLECWILRLTACYGTPQNCNWTLPYAFCLAGERYPGLWEIPMPDMQGADGSDYSTMDPTADSVEALYQQFVTNLLFSYHGVCVGGWWWWGGVNLLTLGATDERGRALLRGVLAALLLGACSWACPLGT